MTNSDMLPLLPPLSLFPLLPLLPPLTLSLSPRQLRDVEEDFKSIRGQLLSVCPSLERLPSLDPLLAVWQGVRLRMFMHYQLSARAYFTFLKLSGSQAGTSAGETSHAAAAVAASSSVSRLIERMCPIFDMYFFMVHMYIRV